MHFIYKKKIGHEKKDGLGKVVVYLRVVLVPLQVLPVNKAFDSFLQVDRLYWKFELSTQRNTQFSPNKGSGRVRTELGDRKRKKRKIRISFVPLFGS